MRNSLPRLQMKTLCSFNDTGFSLLELLAVMALMAILGSVAVLSVKSLRPPGARQGSMDQVMQALEEARMTAIESGNQVYVGFAPADFPDGYARLRAYILFRSPTSDEIAEMAEPPAANAYVALSKWELLPEGFYLDPGASDSILQDTSASMDVDGLPGPPATLVAVAFGNLGQVVWPQSTTPNLSVTEGRYDVSANQLQALAGGGAGTFSIRINRLTGRPQCQEGFSSTHE